MIYTPATGPSPCDLVVITDSPLEEAADATLWALIEAMLGRPRSTCYVTSVCKTAIADADWWRITEYERDRYRAEIAAEVATVQPRLVLAIGARAAYALAPGIEGLSEDHGTGVLGANGRYMVMPLWAPDAGQGAMGMLATDLAKADVLLAEGIVELVQPAPVQPAIDATAWVPAIGFLIFDGERKSAKCMYCGSKEVGAYKGEGLAWKLCRAHAAASALWAATNLGALGEHRDLAVADTFAAKQSRVAAKMEVELREKSAKMAEMARLATSVEG